MSMFSMSRVASRLDNLLTVRLGSVERINIKACRGFRQATSLRAQDRDAFDPKKPDLRKAAGRPQHRKYVIISCILVMIYMYPMIFKPLFGLGSSPDTNDQLENLRKVGLDPSKTRPAYMPEWRSPFGPKSEIEDA